MAMHVKKVVKIYLLRTGEIGDKSDRRHVGMRLLPAAVVPVLSTPGYGDTVAMIDWIEEALLFFGGVPQELLLDQMKAVLGATRSLSVSRTAGASPARVKAVSRSTKGKLERRSAISAASEIFGDDVTAAALIDRLVNHCDLMRTRGNSYRMRQHTGLWQTRHARRSPTPSGAPRSHHQSVSSDIVERIIEARRWHPRYVHENCWRC